MTNWDGLNRRKFPRANYPCLIIIRHSRVGPEAILTHTENIGIGGVCVILKRGLKLFTPVEIEIDLLDTNSHIKCESKVVWSVQRKDTDPAKPSFFDTGLEYMNISMKDQQRISEVVSHLMKTDKEPQ